MDSFARNALRLTLAGAGVVVLGAGFIGQASAAELPDAPSAPEAPDTSLPTDQDLPLQAGDDVTTDVGTPLSTSADSVPTSDVLFDDLPPLEIPGVMYIEAPTVSCAPLPRPRPSTHRRVGGRGASGPVSGPSVPRP